ncbi:hypothetical protein D1B31_16695 [Neobacillus notoginsengisoli]|uniref:Cupin domain-containing protein n=1 Tax=Neobacillus notoginsengisoli TaxID=1578198 RepID=A0A417YQ28_9BACI|nr:hypothetical protein [Neobacillus notoginsengisoli]RHW36356.1 hypothetical protein D1B31_16695 [Neobacillus notoginsengisoli]
MKYSDVKVIYLLENRYVPGRMPKPVLYYPGALKEETIENERELIRKWGSGILGYYRNHRSSHEILGVMQGSAALELGGVRKVQLEVKPGDLIVFPAGTEKRKVSVSPDFKAAGFEANDTDEDVQWFTEEPLYGNNGSQYFQLSFNL